MAPKCHGIGVIGCGKIWEIGHWKGLKEIPDRARVRYVYDLDGAAAEAAARQTGARRVESAQGIDAIFEDDEVDIVAILTPPFARVGFVKRACEAGKHLMLEKPMARTLDEALEIFRVIRRSGVKCFVPFMRALSPARRDVARAIQAGTFGEPLVYSHTFLGVPYPWIPLDHWMHDQEKSGGPVFDFSIHHIEMARACLGAEAEAAFYGGIAVTGRVKSDDRATLLVWYEGGRFGEFTKSWDFPPGCGYGHSADHVVCRDAVIVMGKKTEVRTADGAREFETAPRGVNGRAEAYLNLIAAIEEGTALHADELCGLRTNEILDAMERSRASGSRERVTLHGEAG